MMRTIIEARGIVRTYRNGPRALGGVDLDVPEGTRFALLGPNGAGKSTLTRILCTLSKADAGTVMIDGVPTTGNTVKVRDRIGVALQEVQIDPKSTVENQLRFQGRLYGLDGRAASERAAILMDRFGLTDLSTRAAADLSGGNKRRLHVALALVHRPRVLFLDEPTTGMDPEIRVRFWTEIRKLNREDGTTIFFTTQYLDEAEKHAEELAIIDGGIVSYRGTVAAFAAEHGGPSATGGGAVDESGIGELESGYIRFIEARRTAAKGGAHA